MSMSWPAKSQGRVFTAVEAVGGRQEEQNLRVETTEVCCWTLLREVRSSKRCCTGRSWTAMYMPRL